MTERLYYHDSFLREFEARVVRAGAAGVVLDRTAFYPTSGGQPHDTGTLGGVRVVEVEENDAGEIVHRVEPQLPSAPGATVHGAIDWDRRADHIQQHTGQHLLSAVFIQLFDYPTVSFHLGAETCTIDLTAPAVTLEQARRVEDVCAQIIFENRPVRVFFATPEEARQLPLRKDVDRDGPLRLVEIPRLDLSACGGTHAAHTGQIGSVLVRKTEKFKQGVRVEFVCGRRAVHVARQDYDVLIEAANVFSAHPHAVADLVRKQAEAVKSAEKERQKLLLALAGYQARELYAATPETDGVRQLVKVFDADAAQVRTLAFQFAMQPAARAVFASAGPPTLVLAQTKGLGADLGGLIKKIAGEFGLRGGGSKDSAQAGAPDRAKLDAALAAVVRELA